MSVNVIPEFIFPFTLPTFFAWLKNLTIVLIRKVCYICLDAIQIAIIQRNIPKMALPQPCNAAAQ